MLVNIRFITAKKTTADTAVTEVFKTRICDHYCPGRKLECLVKEE